MCERHLLDEPTGGFAAGRHARIEENTAIRTAELE